MYEPVSEIDVKSILVFTDKLIKNYYEKNKQIVIRDIIDICKIPAPSFQEDERVEFINKYFQGGNYSNLTVENDSFKNVIIRFPGKEKTAKVCILAHIDTVFPKETEINLIKEQSLIKAPGIGDNSTSVGVLLNIINNWIYNEYKPPFDVLFVANSCEEGLGDLKGAKGFLESYCNQEKNVDLKVFLALDGTMNRITHIGPGVKRIKVFVETTGGHSWGDFGRTSAIHVLGKMIAKISRISVPQIPKTTFNVGVIEGGTSVNTIAQQASMLIDMRSESGEELQKLEKVMNKIIEEYEESERDVKVSIKIVGDRPFGALPNDHPIIKIAKEIAEKVGISVELGASSTDANIPLSRGIPAITFGCYLGYGAHTIEEQMEIDSLDKGFPYANGVLLSIINYVDKLE